MKALRPRALQVVCRIVCCLLVLQLSCLDRTWAQTPAPQTLGSLRATREVYLNGSPATGEQTVYPGDTVRTGADGAAALTSPEFGLLIIPAQTEITFRPAPYLATLKQGSVEVRSFQSGKDLAIQFGNTVLYLPSPGTESSGVITLRPDGSAQVSCIVGSIGLKSVDGVGLVVLHPLQSVGVGPDGKLQRVESVPLVPTAQSAPGPVMTGHVPPGRYVGLAVAAGGTAAAIYLLTRNLDHQPVSPSRP
jgi:hypothetical protein